MTERLFTNDWIDFKERKLDFATLSCVFMKKRTGKVIEIRSLIIYNKPINDKGGK